MAGPELAHALQPGRVDVVRSELLDLAADEHVDAAPIGESRHDQPGGRGKCRLVVERRRENAARLIEQAKSFGLLHRVPARVVCLLEGRREIAIRALELHGGGHGALTHRRRRRGQGDDERRHDHEHDERDGVVRILDAKYVGARDDEEFDDERAENGREDAPGHAGNARGQRDRHIKEYECRARDERRKQHRAERRDPDAPQHNRKLSHHRLRGAARCRSRALLGPCDPHSTAVEQSYWNTIPGVRRERSHAFSPRSAILGSRARFPKLGQPT